MSTYPPERLLMLWEQEQIDEKMAIGHILQNLAKQQKAQAATSVTICRFQDKLSTLKAEFEKVKQAVDRLLVLVEKLFPDQASSNPDRSA